MDQQWPKLKIIYQIIARISTMTLIFCSVSNIDNFQGEPKTFFKAIERTTNDLNWVAWEFKFYKTHTYIQKRFENWFLRVAQPWALQYLHILIPLICQIFTKINTFEHMHSIWHTQFDPYNLTHTMWPTQCEPLNVTHIIWPTQYDPLNVTNDHHKLSQHRN